jgi:hypothetical protein
MRGVRFAVLEEKKAASSRKSALDGTKRTFYTLVVETPVCMYVYIYIYILIIRDSDYIEPRARFCVFSRDALFFLRAILRFNARARLARSTPK